MRRVLRRPQPGWRCIRRIDGRFRGRAAGLRALVGRYVERREAARIADVRHVLAEARVLAGGGGRAGSGPGVRRRPGARRRSGAGAVATAAAAATAAATTAAPARRPLLVFGAAGALRRVAARVAGRCFHRAFVVLRRRARLGRALVATALTAIVATLRVPRTVK